MFKSVFGKSEPAPEPATQTSSPVIMTGDVPSKAETNARKVVQKATPVIELIPEKPKLENPGKYDDIQKESKSVLNPGEVFDGFRFEFNRGFGDVFSVAHIIQMGSVMEPPSYNFGTTLINGGTVMFGRVDTEGNVMGKWQQELSKRSLIRLGGVASNEGGNSHASLETDYLGSDWTGQFKWQSPGVFAASYLQSITKKLSLGCEGYYNHDQAMSAFSFGSRYDTPTWVGNVMLSPASISVSYIHKVASYCNLATEFAAQASPNGFETMWSSGLEYRFRASTFKAYVDSVWRFSAIFEEALNPNTKFTLNGELNHDKKQYRMGFGFTINI